MPSDCKIIKDKITIAIHKSVIWLMMQKYFD